MSQQIKFVTPNNDWAAIDNSAAPSPTTLNAGTLQGYDTTAPGATSQGLNSFADTETRGTDGTFPNNMAIGIT
jgi:hypothetical protein